MRRLLRINLEDRYEIVDTGDPELALAAALQSKPNAILLDLRMPNYSGFELCRTFKSMTSTQLIPIIIVTGEAGASTKSFCEELGATAYFEKPVDFEALRGRLAEILETALARAAKRSAHQPASHGEAAGNDRQRKAFRGTVRHGERQPKHILLRLRSPPEEEFRGCGIPGQWSEKIRWNGARREVRGGQSAPLPVCVPIRPERCQLDSAVAPCFYAHPPMPVVGARITEQYIYSASTLPFALAARIQDPWDRAAADLRPFNNSPATKER